MASGVGREQEDIWLRRRREGAGAGQLHLRESFLYGREFLGDADLAEQLETWLCRVANVRTHGTTGERPLERFLRDERHLLQPLASRPYRSLILLPQEPAPSAVRLLPRVEVERRSLGTYAAIAAGGV
jgi:hypothetical protein